MSLMFTSLKPEDPYYPNWLNLRRRTRRFWIIFWIWPLMFALLVGLFKNAFVAFPVALLIVAAARFYQATWPCPRCGEPFYYDNRWLWYWPFALRCMHCGLQEYASNAEG